MNDPDREQSPGTSRTALRHHVVKQLLVKIIRGEIGPGTRLIANALAFQLGVSATPVREALVELEQSGVVELVHHKGAVVKPFGRSELRDFYHVRGLLHCAAVRLACGRVAEVRLDTLRGEVQRLRGEPGPGDSSHDGRLAKDIFLIDERIRQVLVEHCRNKWLVAELGRFNAIEGALREIAESSRIHEREALSPAVELADALCNNRPEAGASAMQKHVDVLAAAVEASIFDSRP
jgi:DNA-binding GntR family transcriptional regulator